MRLLALLLVIAETAKATDILHLAEVAVTVLRATVRRAVVAVVRMALAIATIHKAVVLLPQEVFLEVVVVVREVVATHEVAVVVLLALVLLDHAALVRNVLAHN